ncbi:MAG: glycosyltransferase family 39 protein [Synergistaceae bacterium]|nr:glycosyltransferase family 39 protein [Synergistaceae bacterium]
MWTARRTACLIFAVLAYLFLRGIGDHGLIDPIEGINASIALNMAGGGSLARPMLASRLLASPGAGDLLYPGKAMGYWWLSAGALWLFRGFEFPVRFWPMLGGLGMAAAAWFTTRRISGARGANYAAILTGSCLLTYTVSQIASPHSLYACLISAALAGAIHAFRDKRFFLLLHAAAVLAFVAYGPAGIILPWLSLLTYAILMGRGRFFLEAFLYWPGLLATFLPTVGYLSFLHAKNPGVLSLMVYNPPAPAFGSLSSSFLVLAAGFFPWMGFLPHAVKNALPRRFFFPVSPVPHSPLLFLLIWAAVFLIFGFFSRDAFLLAASAPALASLCAVHLTDAVERNDVSLFQRMIALKILLSVPLIFFGLPLAYLSSPETMQSMSMTVLPWALFSLFLLFAGWRCAKQRKPRKLMFQLCLLALVCLLPLGGSFDLLAERLSVRDAGLWLRRMLKPGDVLIQYMMSRPSLYYYAGRDSELIDAPVIPGVPQRESRREFFLYQAWIGGRRVFMLIGRDREFLTPLPGEVHSPCETRHFIVVSNRED